MPKTRVCARKYIFLFLKNRMKMRENKRGKITPRNRFNLPCHVDRFNPEDGPEKKPSQIYYAPRKRTVLSLSLCILAWWHYKPWFYPIIVLQSHAKKDKKVYYLFWGGSFFSYCQYGARCWNLYYFFLENQNLPKKKKKKGEIKWQHKKKEKWKGEMLKTVLFHS